MSLEAVLNGWMSERRDVTFPVRFDVTPSAFTPYGFDDAGRAFSPHWTMQFFNETRLLAAFTGVVYAHHDVGTDEYFLNLLIAATDPIRPIAYYPVWYPMPDYARYGPFTEAQVRQVAVNLLTETEAPIAALIAPADRDAASTRLERNETRFAVTRSALVVDEPAETATRDNIIRLFMSNGLDSGIPVAAGEVLLRKAVTSDFFFSLHPAVSTDESDGWVLNETLFMDPSFYFRLWGSRVIEGFSDFAEVFRQKSIGPPLTTGRVHYVRQTPDPTISATQHPTVEAAIAGMQDNDTILILDRQTYQVRAALDRFMSIIGLVPRDHDPKGYKELAETILRRELAANYPTLQGPASGYRGLLIQYRNGAWPTTRSGSAAGMIYVSGVNISGNDLNINDERARYKLGGAGVLVDGRYFDGNPEEGAEVAGRHFSAVHLDRCAITSNTMTGNFDLPMQGAGLMCHYSSPVISDCLLKFNHSQYQGAGIGIHTYSFPKILNNVLRNNVARGMSMPTEPHAGGDGGAIGVFQAPPDAARRAAFEAEFLSIVDSIDADSSAEFVAELASRSDLVESLSEGFRGAWIAEYLARARRERIEIVGNEIRDNWARLSGGGVYVTVCGFVRLVDNDIRGNNAGERGGGIAITLGSDVIVKSCRISENFATEYGGGVYVRSSKLKLISSSVEANRSLSEGGGIMVESRAEDLLNTPVGPLPVYDGMLHEVYTHITLSALTVIETEVASNRADSPRLRSIYGRRDDRGFGTAVSVIARGLRGLSFIEPLPLRVVVDAASMVSPDGVLENVGEGTSRTIVPGTAEEV